MTEKEQFKEWLTNQIILWTKGTLKVEKIDVSQLREREDGKRLLIRDMKVTLQKVSAGEFLFTPSQADIVTTLNLSLLAHVVSFSFEDLSIDVWLSPSFGIRFFFPYLRLDTSSSSSSHNN